jgi:hypothetical protein
VPLTCPCLEESSRCFGAVEVFCAANNRSIWAYAFSEFTRGICERTWRSFWDSWTKLIDDSKLPLQARVRQLVSWGRGEMRMRSKSGGLAKGSVGQDTRLYLYKTVYTLHHLDL